MIHRLLITARAVIGAIPHIFGGGCRRAVDAAVVGWTCMRQHRRTCFALAALVILCSGAVTLKRIVIQRADIAALASRGLQAGEMVYLVNDDGSVTLRIGDGETVYGRTPTDPAAVRVAAQRVLDPLTDYYVETYGGATANANGSYSIGVAAIAATGGVRVVVINPDTSLSAVSFDTAFMGDTDPQTPPTAYVLKSPDEFVSTTTNSVTITAGASGSEWILFSNLVVSAWVDRTPMGATNDFRQSLVHVADATLASSPTTFGQMQAWLDNNEGKHWSLWPALGHVYLAGYQLISGTNSWTIGSHSNNLVIAHAGHRIATFSEATDTNACPSILSAIKNTNGTFSIWVAASPVSTRAPEVASTVSIIPPVVWLPYATSSNSWPSTVSLNGTNCYYLVCPSPEASRFFRVFIERATTTPSALSVRSLKIDGYTIYLHTNGVVMWQ